MSGKKQRETRSHERHREEEAAEANGEMYRTTISLPEELLSEMKRTARAQGKSVNEVIREHLGAAQAKVPKGPLAKVQHEEMTYNRISFATVSPADLPLPIDSRNQWAQRQIFMCLGGRFKHGTQLYPHDRRGSGNLLLYDEPGQEQCLYHFPIFDKPGQEHWAAVQRFNVITRTFIPLSEPKRLLHPEYAEWRRLQRDLYNLHVPSVTTLLVKAIWLEYCQSALRALGHATPDALVNRGQYDEKRQGFDMWLAPGRVHRIEAQADVLPIEILRRQLQNAC